MKTTDKIILLSGLLFGILFYEQAAGVNFFIFSLVQVLAIYYTTPKERKTRNWWLVFAGVNVSAFAILLYGAALGVWLNVISLFLLANISIEPKSSLIVSLFHSLYTVFSGVVHIVTDIMAKTVEKSGWKGYSRLFKNVVIGVVSFVIALIFIALYRDSNVAFKDLTDKIDLSFISAEWIVFTLFGYYLVYLMYRPRNIHQVKTFDQEANNNLEENATGIAAKWMSVKSEFTWAKTLLSMLNIVLLVVLFSEIAYELGLVELDAEVGYSENVHTGVNALIFSIILAVGLILFFFQGRLNFIKENKWLKLLAIIWIVQNVLLVVLTAYKNVLYVEQYSLTYKRIGVFVYLISCLIGLVYTYIKIAQAKSNWFLVRKVGWAIYATFLLAPIVNWDYVIIQYNFSIAKNHPEDLDVDYLLELPDSNYPLIYSKLEGFREYFPDQWEGRYLNLHHFYEKATMRDWRSFNFRIFTAIKTKNYKDEISYQY